VNCQEPNPRRVPPRRPSAPSFSRCAFDLQEEPERKTGPTGFRFFAPPSNRSIKRLYAFE
jgi:hypothetical protein